MTTNSNDCPDNSVKAEGSGHVQIVKLDLSPVTVLAIACLTLVVGACGVVMGMNISQMQFMTRAYENEQRAWRYSELKYDELNLVVRRAGLVLPEDKSQGVSGNLEENSFKKPGGK